MLKPAEMLQQFFKRSKLKSHPALSVAADERVYAIGDIHGRCDLLIAMLDKIHQDAVAQQDDRRTRLVLLGDYIDRGDQSNEVLETLAALCADRIAGVTPLMGNHEAALLKFLSDPVANSEWLNYGARQTLASYGITQKSANPNPDERQKIRNDLRWAMGVHATFLENLHPLARSGDVVFAHAGFRPPIEGGSTELDLDSVLWGYPEFLTEQPVAGVRVVHGHYDNVRPISLPGRVCVDTGAYYSGVLTAVRLDDGETILSVKTSDPR